MRKISKIIVHCTATPRGRDVTVDEIRACHVGQNGWSDIGYHYVVYLDGSVHRGRPEEQVGAHCHGQNSDSIGVAYVGGVEADGTPADTRTPAQREAIKRLVGSLREKYGTGVTVHGHNEFAAKACPSFNVRAEFKTILVVLTAWMLTACGSAKKVVNKRVDVDEQRVELTKHDVEKTVNLTEFSEAEVVADSVVFEMVASDGFPVTKIKTGPVKLKMSREKQGQSRVVGREERVSQQDCQFKSDSRSVTAVKNDWTRLIVGAILVVLLVVLTSKMVKT